MGKIDRMLFDLNLPPPPHWETGEEDEAALSSEARQPSPQKEVETNSIDTPVSQLAETAGATAGVDTSIAKAKSEADTVGLKPEAGATIRCDEIVEPRSAKASDHVEPVPISAGYGSPQASPQTPVDLAKGSPTRPGESRDGDPNPPAPDLCQEVSDLNVGSSSSSADVHADDVIGRRRSLKGERKIRQNGPEVVPASRPASELEASELEDKMDLPDSVPLDSNDTSSANATNINGEVRAKVHKRLRTLGQLRNRKVDKDAVARAADDPSSADVLEDEIVSRPKPQGLEEASSASAKVSRAANHSWARKGDRSTVLSNGDSATRKPALSDQTRKSALSDQTRKSALSDQTRKSAPSDQTLRSGVTDLGRKAVSRDHTAADGGSKSQDQSSDTFFLGRFPKIPSQPRSRKPGKRVNLVPPTVVSEARDEARMQRGCAGDKPPTRTVSGTTCREEKVSSASASVLNERSADESIDVDKKKTEAGEERKPGEAKEGSSGLKEVEAGDDNREKDSKDSAAPASDVAAQSAGAKRPGTGLQYPMPGKRRRKTVFLNVFDLKQAPPLRQGTEGVHRNLRVRRDAPARTPPAPVSEDTVADKRGSGAPVSISRTEPSRTPSPDESVDEIVKSEKVMKPQLGDAPAQFRRPSLKRPSSAVFSRETSLKESSGHGRSVAGKELEVENSKGIGGASEGLDPQKPRRMLRKTDTKQHTSAIQDTSVERLHREATCAKLWQTSGGTDLQQVPGRFESVEDYVRVLEPLLFEECRAQLRSTWEELSDGVVKDPHVPVIVKSVERRERGWYDVVVLPENPHTIFKFKEGDAAVISSPSPASAAGRPKGKMKGHHNQERNTPVTKRITGIVRRYYPTDVRDPHGAVLHFHVSQDDAEIPSTSDPTIYNSNALKELERQGLPWYLTALGAVTTTQREYIALHFLQQFHPKMLNAILQPRPELFPGYADQEPPAMPECFTAAFLQHLHEQFNGPQLAAIQWAGAHTAAGGVGGLGGTAGTPKQEPWPFTLVQGPPGTGKTHTVWGMLNVIHLVQYQRYYQALLKKLAPSSLAAEEPSPTTQGSYETGSIDDVLQRMDDSLARMLPKLCPKPRMLVCAPSNAATDELLSRVLDRGFIDGEMKVYRPDVARVGSDPHSRAAQAVSVERRSEQLLGMGREQVVGWLQQLRGKEMSCSQLITTLQKNLNEVASARSQGNNFGVDPEKLAARDQERDSKLQQLAALVEERDKILVEMSRLFIVEGSFRPGSGFSLDDARQKLEASFANEAEIVFTTVSSSGRRIFQKLAHGFDMVVIDEAAQASEVAILPPLSLRAARCVLVGDPQQLPATVISRVADTMQYSRSLFERFQQAGCPAILLSVQFRMHPQIRDFPSRYFYQGRLVDSKSVTDKPAEVYHKDQLLQPYLFYDISQGRESHGGSVSYQNRLEAQVAVRLYLHLQRVVAAAGSLASVSVGMITPYKQQLKCLQSEFEALAGAKADSKGVYINTVDAFQGQERDVIIMSCVRASSHGVGFVSDIRRMNVALTRARRALWVIGNATALQQSEDWAALIADARSRTAVVETSACIAQGLLPDHFTGISPGTAQAGQAFMRQQAFPQRRMDFPPSYSRSHSMGSGNFSGELSARQQQTPLGADNDHWKVTEFRGPREVPVGARNFTQRNFPPNRLVGGRGAHLPFHRSR